MFRLDPVLEQDTAEIGSLSLSSLLLMDNAHFPWVILVPKREGMTEISDLIEEDQNALFKEILLTSRVMQQHLTPYKMNIAALGNQVRQLHVHMIARFEGDAAWPKPVWGGASTPYTTSDKIARLKEFREWFSPYFA